MKISPEKPNILLLFADQHRFDALGCAGHPLVQTPHLDALADSGAIFPNVWSQSPFCQPSRASFITGQYVSSLRYRYPGKMSSRWNTLMHFVQKQGYETATVGKTHYYLLGKEPLQLSVSGGLKRSPNIKFVESFGWDYVHEEFDKYLHVPPQNETPYLAFLRKAKYEATYKKQIASVMRGTKTQWCGQQSALPEDFDLSSYLTDKAIDWLDGRKSKNPFFLKLALVQPHVPHISDKGSFALYKGAKLDLAEDELALSENKEWSQHLEYLVATSHIKNMRKTQLKDSILHYYSMITLIDRKIGQLIAYLKETSQFDNTWIIYCSDHGEMLGDKKQFGKQCFFKGSVQVPLIIKPPAHVAGAVTINNLVELIDVTETIADISSGASGSANFGRGESLMDLVTHKGAKRTKQFAVSEFGKFIAVRDERFRLTLVKRTGKICEFYDLKEDPCEKNNILDCSAFRQQIDDLRSKLNNTL